MLCDIGLEAGVILLYRMGGMGTIVWYRRGDRVNTVWYKMEGWGNSFYIGWEVR